MSGARLEIQWSPVDNKQFITWGSELCLYDVDSLTNYAGKSCMRLSEQTGAQLLATNSNSHYVKCVDIYPKANSDLFLAVGQANGRVALTTFGPSEFDNLGLTGRELVPRHARQCNTVAWNPIEPNIVAAGLEKYRTDHSLLIWDIKKCSIANENNGTTRLMNNSNNSQLNALAAAAVELPKPMVELCVSESVNALAWFVTTPRMMAVGINQKSLKIIDHRDTCKVVNSAQTKSVYGISVHPHNDRHLASFIDNIITVWDTRNFERPIITLTHNKPVVKIHWSLTRHNLLGSLQRDSSVIHLHDIQHTMVGNEEVEPSVLERTVVPGSPHNITSFSWHPQDENRLLTIALSGNITDYIVYERITLNWAPNSNMSWTFGRKTIKYVDEKTGCLHLQDISSKIKQRCLDGYGLKSEFWQNGEITGDPMLVSIWNWLHLSRNLLDHWDLRTIATRHPGVKSVLKIDNGNGLNGLKSEAIQTPWLDLGNVYCHGSARIYKSEDRDKALHLCDWGFDKDVNLFSMCIERLEKEHLYSRAAAIAVFNLKIRLAIDILNRGSEKLDNNHLNVVAMALAGFTDDKNSMWRQLCANTKATLTDPYLRAMFSFLTAENYNYESVLNENGMSVEDRVAFACIFLSDKKLYDYLNNLTVRLIEEGNLYGLLLTGTVKEGLSLLQKYLDFTGDIQTTTLVAVKTFATELLQELCVQEWILSYRNLLDSWHFWNQRAHFDIMLSACSPADKPPQQVYVSCNFCGKSISAYMQGLNRGRGPFSRLGATSNKLKMSSCPNCRKPLPRCAICLMHMGTASGSPGYPGVDGESKMVEFSSWFTWCQSCRHGGHATHMINWFKEHSECPVTPCTCRCFSVDAVENPTQECF